MHCPDTHLLSSLAIQATTCAMSFGVAILRSTGVFAASSFTSSASVDELSRSDCVEPGAIVLTVTPLSPSSAAQDLVNASIASFDDVYKEMPGTPTLAAVEPILMIRAFLDLKCGSTACVMKTAARTFVLNISEKSSSVTVSSGVDLLMPALLTRISIRGPNVATVASTILRGEAESRRSA